MIKWWFHPAPVCILFVLISLFIITCSSTDNTLYTANGEDGKVKNNVQNTEQQQEERESLEDTQKTELPYNQFDEPKVTENSNNVEKDKRYTKSKKDKRSQNTYNSDDNNNINNANTSSDEGDMDSKNIANSQCDFVHLSPSFLQYRERPLCSPTTEVIEIKNLHEKEDLILLSTSSESPHIHTTSFQQSLVPPLTSTNISVTFLPCTLGPIEGVVLIETNLGSISYQVQGTGILSPYRVRPLIGTKIAYNSVYSIPITIYNPHARELHITEIFTSNASLHLEPPADKSQDQTKLWDIAPHESRVVIYLTFASTNLGKQAGYVNVKTDKGALVIHVDITVVNEGVHHVPDDVIDFGALVAYNSSVNASLTLLNAGSSPVRIEKLYVKDDDVNMNISTITTTIPPHAEIAVATLIYTARVKVDNKLGVIHIRTSDTKIRMEVRYRARVIVGAVTFPKANTLLYIGAPPFKPVIQQILLANAFPVPIAIYSVAAADRKVRLMDFPAGQLAQPDSTWPPLTVRYFPDNPDVAYSTSIFVTTNFTTHIVPIHIFHGRLTCTLAGSSCPCPLVSSEKTEDPNKKMVQVPDDINLPFSEGLIACSGSSLDFGMIGLNEVKTKNLNLTNPNPVTVNILGVSTDLERVGIRLESVWTSSGVMATSGWETTKNQGYLNKKPVVEANEEILQLDPGNSAIFGVEVSCKSEERQQGHITIQTQYHTMEIPMRYHSISGDITFTPPVLQFGDSFPGAILTLPIYARSSFKNAVRLISVTSSDPRIRADLTNNTLKEDADTLVANVHLDLARDEHSETSKLSGPGKPLNKYDIATYKQRPYGKFDLRASLSFASDLITFHSMLVHASMTKPNPLPLDIDFGTVQIGSQASSYIPFHNAADKPVWVQLVPPEQTIQLASDDSEDEDVDMKASEVYHFSLEALDVVLVEPHSTAQLGPVTFLPKDQAIVSHTLLVKNNLSVVASTNLHGSGGSGKLEFLKGREVKSQLSFEVEADKLVEGCQHSAVDFHSFEVVQNFDLVNSGNLPIIVESVSINGKQCSGYGFTVHNCGQLTLNRGQRTSLSVSFKPDFSSSVVQRDLHFQTSQGFISLPLVAKIPHEHLARCNSMQAHVTDQDEWLRIVVLSVLGVLFVVLAILTLREYRELRSRPPSTLPLSTPLEQANVSDIGLEDPLLSQLPELDTSSQGVSLPSDFVEKYARLTYDGYRPRKKSSPLMVTAVRPSPRNSNNNTSNNNNNNSNSNITPTTNNNNEKAKPLNSTTREMHPNISATAKSHEVGSTQDSVNKYPTIQDTAKSHSPPLPQSSIFTPIHPPNTPTPTLPGVLHKPTVSRTHTRSAQNVDNNNAHNAASVTSTTTLPNGQENDTGAEGTKKRSNSVAEDGNSSASTKQRTSSDPASLQLKPAAPPVPPAVANGPSKPNDVHRKKKPLEPQQQNAKRTQHALPTAPNVSVVTTLSTTAPQNAGEDRPHPEHEKRAPAKKDINPRNLNNNAVEGLTSSPKTVKRMPPAPPPPPGRMLAKTQSTAAAYAPATAQYVSPMGVAPIASIETGSQPLPANQPYNRTYTFTAAGRGGPMARPSSGNYADLKKSRGRDPRDLGIHRRDLVKAGSIALPPNMAFVPKKRPAPPATPSSPFTTTTYPPTTHAFKPPTSSSNNDREVRHIVKEPYIPTAPPSPKWGFQSSWKRAPSDTRNVHPGMQFPIPDGILSDSSSLSGDTVGSLGGVTLSNSMEVKQQRKEAIGVIGSGKTVPPPPSGSQAQSNASSGLARLPFQPLHTVTSAELFSFYSPLSSNNESSFFSNTQISSYYFSTKRTPPPTPITPPSPTSLHHPLPEATTSPSYDLFASAPLFNNRKRSDSDVDKAPAFFDFSLLDPSDDE